MKIRNKKTGKLTYMCETRISFLTEDFKSFWYDSLKDFCENWEIVEEQE